MKKSWIFLSARRLIRSKRRSRSSVTALLSTLGLAAGIMTLITVISVMNGFQLNTIEDLIEINSFHLRIRQPFPDEPEKMESIPGISQVFPIIETQALLKGPFSGSQTVMLKAVEPELLRENTTFAQRIGLPDNIHLTDNSVIIGRELARFLGVERGDVIQAIGLGGGEIALNNPVEIELVIIGFFVSGYYEFDRNWAFISLDTAEQDFQTGYRKELAIKIDERMADLTIMQELLTRYPGLDKERIQSWREFNRSIFGALRVEKTLMAFLIGLIFLVVGVNIFQGLRRSVHEHLEDIAVLKVLGASERNVRMVFVFEGILIALMGVTIGLPAGVLVSTRINEIFGFVETIVGFVRRTGNFQIFSPTYFYLKEVPVHIIPGEMLAIVFVASTSAIVSAYAAARQIVSLKPREVFNNE